MLFNQNAATRITNGEGPMPLAMASTEAEAQYQEVPDDSAHPTYGPGAGSFRPV